MKTIFTESDKGGVLVGTKEWAILVPNGYGDGETVCKILEAGESVPEDARYFTTISGEINIYRADYVERIPENIAYTFDKIVDGVYEIYSRGDHEFNCGYVYFKRREK